MILKITLILASLVALNFLLLIFSCNKTTKKQAKPKQLKPVVSKKAETNQLPERQLAPTGS